MGYKVWNTIVFQSVFASVPNTLSHMARNTLVFLPVCPSLTCTSYQIDTRPCTRPCSSQFKIINSHRIWTCPCTSQVQNAPSIQSIHDLRHAHVSSHVALGLKYLISQIDTRPRTCLCTRPCSSQI